MIDRYYFKSIYFREPSGVLFEIATIGPGFTADEPLESLGERLSLPPDYEQLRDRLEQVLTPLPDTRARPHGEVTIEHRLRPPAAEPEGLLVLFHGRGADEHDLFPLLDVLDPERRLLGVTPRGPLSLPPGGAHWYAVQEIGFPDPGTFLPTYAAVSDWLDGLEDETGIGPERTVLGGFSQGAVMTYSLGLGRGRPRPAALVALSGFIPTVEGFELDLQATVTAGRDRPRCPRPGHLGRMEPTGQGAAGGRGRARSLYREYPLPHAVDPGFLAELVPWIPAALAARATAA